MSIHSPARARVIEAHPPIVPRALGRKVRFLAGEGPKLELKRPAARSNSASTECLLVAQSRHCRADGQCPPLAVKRTAVTLIPVTTMSGPLPKRCKLPADVRYWHKADIGPQMAASIDFLLCLKKLLNFTRCVFSTLCLALSLCTLFFLTSLLLKFGLRSPSSLAVEKSFSCVHQSPFFGALIFSISQKYALTHIVYIGLIRTVEP